MYPLFRNYYTLIYIIYLARKLNLSASIRFDGQKSVKLVSGIELTFNHYLDLNQYISHLIKNLVHHFDN